MRYYYWPAFDGIEGLALGSRPEPIPGPRQVLVRMRAWSLNHRDLLIADNRYGRDIEPGLIPVSDGAGDVVDVGPDVTRWRAGDRVMGVFMPNWLTGPPTDENTRAALGGTVDGLLAEYVVFDEEALLGVPEHLDFTEAATLPCAAATVWHCFLGAGPLSEQQVLTLGSGGVSVFAVQFAAVSGARVLSTSSSDERLARLASLGASAGVNYVNTPEWGRAIFELSHGGVDHVIEVGGAGTLSESIRAVRTGGRISLVGVLSQGVGLSPVPLLRKALTIRGMLVGSRDTAESMCAFVSEHRIHPVIDSVFPFSEVIEAYRHLASKSHFGKVVISR